MSIIIRRSVVVLPVAIAGMILFWGAVEAPQPIRAEEQINPRSTTTDAYLELSVVPQIALSGTLVTLNITYHHIGMPYTAITSSPPGLVTFDPPLSMPCKYDQHPTGCQAIPFRTQSSGVVQFTAGASGEVYDEGCGCFRWGTALDNGPATLIIVDTLWQMFLPSIQR
jgi:endo-1,4-beta-xylanase